MSHVTAVAEPGGKWSSQTRADGRSLAVLLVAIFTIEAFDAARADIHSLAEAANFGPAAAHAATPHWLWLAWPVVAVAGAAVAGYVTHRFLEITTELEVNEHRRRLRAAHRHLRTIAWSAVVAWLVWQASGILVIWGAYWIPSWLVLLLHGLAALAALVAVGLGGAVIGDATTALERAPVVRLQAVFLLVLFVIVFHAGFVSDQLTDVLRGWGDGPISRPLAGCAAALLLGAVVRASSSRLLLPHESGTPTGSYRLATTVASRAQTARNDHAKRVSGPLFAAGAGVALLVAGPRALGFAILAGAALAGCTQPASSPPDDWNTSGLRRLAGSLGVVPLAILVVGLTEASANSLLLPSAPTRTDVALFICTGVVVAAFALLAAHAHVAVGRPFVRKDVRGELFGAIGLGAALASLWSPAAAAVLLLVLGVLLASRRFGERGAVELWSAWGVGLGLATAIYVEPVGVSRGLGGFAIALLGATAILALLHPAGSIGARYVLKGAPARRAPVLWVLAFWLAFAWLAAPTSRNAIRTVDASAPPIPVSSAVGDWLARESDKPASPGNTCRCSSSPPAAAEPRRRSGPTSCSTAPSALHRRRTTATSARARPRRRSVRLVCLPPAASAAARSASTTCFETTRRSDGGRTGWPRPPALRCSPPCWRGACFTICPHS
jgi:hypothetical protein